MKKTLSILFIIISFTASAQDSSKIYSLSLQAKLIEYLTPQMSNIDNDSLYTTFLDIRKTFRASKPTGNTTVSIDSIPTVELANLYNYTLSNSDGLSVSNQMKTQIASARTASTYLNRLCTDMETTWLNKLVNMRINGRKLLLGK